MHEAMLIPIVMVNHAIALYYEERDVKFRFAKNYQQLIL